SGAASDVVSPVSTGTPPASASLANRTPLITFRQYRSARIVPPGLRRARNQHLSRRTRLWCATQVRDLERAVAFYTRYLGFGTTQRSGPVAIIARGDLHLLLSGPGS